MTKMDIYEVTYSKAVAEGACKWVHETYREKHDEIVQLVHPAIDESSNSVHQPLDPEVAFRRVMPPDHGGFVRSTERAYTLSTWYGRKGAVSSIVVDQLYQKIDILQRRDEERERGER